MNLNHTKAIVIIIIGIVAIYLFAKYVLGVDDETFKAFPALT
jgi:hypothetical protein